MKKVTCKSYTVRCSRNGNFYRNYYVPKGNRLSTGEALIAFILQIIGLIIIFNIII